MTQDTLDPSHGSAVGATSGAMGSFGSERAASSHGGTVKSQTSGSRHRPASKEVLQGYGYGGDTGYGTGQARTPASETAPTWADVLEQSQGSGTGQNSYAALQSRAVEQLRAHPWLTLTLSFAAGLALTNWYRHQRRAKSPR